MASLPIPASLYFEDFSDNVIEYDVLDSQDVIASCKGLLNSDSDGDYISFLVSDNPQISVGSVLRTKDGLEEYTVRHVGYDRYNGKAELFKAYF